ncbi:MAG TPA: hypothetical protein PLD02_04960 [Saprospiraceae bacterium]|nr:hypothetical protein [Saprospiraceae bacterium]
METKSNILSRKKFILWGTAFIAGISAFKLFPKTKKPENVMCNDSVKMLTQDGRLVIIKKSDINTPSQKISNEELQHWVNNK